MRWRRPSVRFLATAAVALLFAAGFHAMTGMPGASHTGALPPPSAEEREIEARLARHVAVLAGEIGERHVWRHAALEAAADHIAQTLRQLGYAVSEQAYVAEGKTVRNIEAELPGRRLPGEIVLIGAHYDSVPGSPGANDNASGVAALLEIARLLAGRPQARSVRFVAFTNEEPPFFYSAQMGSRVYARRARERNEDIVAMLALETLGYYDDAPGSQHYPIPLYRLRYPDSGDFVAFVGNLSSRALVRRSLASFRRDTRFPAEGVAAPGWMGGVHWSDHAAFWHEGYPALMVTDTALFRYPHYHGASDTPDKLDYARLARVTAGLARVTADLAEQGP